MDATPEQVWAVLADAPSYGNFVVGSRRIRSADPEWPEPGSTLHHCVGIGPLTIRDSTTSLEAVPPRRLVIHARFRPLGSARVEFRLAHARTGTEVVMTETLAGGPWNLPIARPLVHGLVAVRNREVLRRLRRLARRRATNVRPERGHADQRAG